VEAAVAYWRWRRGCLGWRGCWRCSWGGPSAVALLRKRALRKGPPERRLLASLSLLRTQLRDHGLAIPKSYALDELADFLHAYLGVDAGQLPEADRGCNLRANGKRLRQTSKTTEAFRREVVRCVRHRAGDLEQLLA